MTLKEIIDNKTVMTFDSDDMILHIKKEWLDRYGIDTDKYKNISEYSNELIYYKDTDILAYKLKEGINIFDIFKMVKE